MQRTIEKEETIIEGQLNSHKIIVPDHAQLNLFSIHTAAKPEPIAQHITLHSNSIARLFTVLFNTADFSATAVVEGDHAAYEHFIIYFGGDDAKIRIHTNTQHNGKQTLSRTLVHGVACGKARIDFTGNIDITQTGTQTDSHLEHEGLLLSRKARIDSLPGFTIDTNDVKAIHSSAVHFIRPEQIFYLQSRGIDELNAKHLIVDGFLKNMLGYIHDVPTVQTVAQLIEEKVQRI